jgi:hypothetical protein
MFPFVAFASTAPNALRFSCLAGCARLVSSIHQKHRRAYQRKQKAEGQVSCKRGLGGAGTLAKEKMTDNVPFV